MLRKALSGWGSSDESWLAVGDSPEIGMNNTVFDNGQNIFPNKANNYLHDYGKMVRVPYTNNLYSTGAGALVTNCDDLQIGYECLINRKILPEYAYRIYLSENKNNYCYGLERYEEDICNIVISNKGIPRSISFREWHCCNPT